MIEARRGTAGKRSPRGDAYRSFRTHLLDWFRALAPRPGKPDSHDEPTDGGATFCSRSADHYPRTTRMLRSHRPTLLL